MMRPVTREAPSPKLWAERIGQSWHRAHDRSKLESIEGTTGRRAPGEDATLRRRANSDLEFEVAKETLERIDRGIDLEPRHIATLEAIIEPENRPVIDITDDSYTDVPWNWPQLGDAEVRTALERVIPSIGRVELPDHPSIPYGGTAFFVGAGLMMTNRHVAELFTDGLGNRGLRFKPGQRSEVDLRQEVVPAEPRLLDVEEVVMIHPYWDCALLRVSGDGALLEPLRLIETEPSTVAARQVAIVGYPALDRRNDIDLQRRIFRVFEKKRLQPGMILGYDFIFSYGNEVQALTHDISTLGGNSGSAVIDLYSGNVVGLHFAGLQRIANFAVPAWELARDPRIVDAGVTFVRPRRPEVPPPWENSWHELQPPSGGAGGLFG